MQQDAIACAIAMSASNDTYRCVCVYVWSSIRTYIHIHSSSYRIHTGLYACMHAMMMMMCVCMYVRMLLLGRVCVCVYVCSTQGQSIALCIYVHTYVKCGLRHKVSFSIYIHTHMCVCVYSRQDQSIAIHAYVHTYVSVCGSDIWSAFRYTYTHMCMCVCSRYDQSISIHTYVHTYVSVCGSDIRSTCRYMYHRKRYHIISIPKQTQAHTSINTYINKHTHTHYTENAATSATWHRRPSHDAHAVVSHKTAPLNTNMHDTHQYTLHIQAHTSPNTHTHTTQKALPPLPRGIGVPLTMFTLSSRTKLLLSTQICMTYINTHYTYKHIHH
jgi:hypothetical protein